MLKLKYLMGNIFYTCLLHTGVQFERDDCLPKKRDRWNTILVQKTQVVRLKYIIYRFNYCLISYIKSCYFLKLFMRQLAVYWCHRPQ